MAFDYNFILSYSFLFFCFFCFVRLVDYEINIVCRLLLAGPSILGPTYTSRWRHHRQVAMVPMVLVCVSLFYIIFHASIDLDLFRCCFLYFNFHSNANEDFENTKLLLLLLLFFQGGSVYNGNTCQFASGSLPTSLQLLNVTTSLSIVW